MRKQGRLQPLDIPGSVWEDLSTDFVTHLPISFGHTAIWVICDRLTKFPHFIALPAKFTAPVLQLDSQLKFVDCMVFPNPLCQTAIPYSLALFGRSSFTFRGPPYATTPPTTHKLMATPRLSIEGLRRTYVA